MHSKHMSEADIYVVKMKVVTYFSEQFEDRVLKESEIEMLFTEKVGN